MVGVLAFWLWVGGMGAVYAKGRASGVGRFGSALNAFIWPAGVGQYIARRFHEDWG